MPNTPFDFDPLRRSLLVAGCSNWLLAPLLTTVGLVPLRVLAADVGRLAFQATSLAEALQATGANGSLESTMIFIKAVDISENGAQVPIEVVSNIAASQQMLIFVDRNPLPLAAKLTFANGAVPRARLQLKMAETSRVRVVIKAADGKTYHASREIKVTIGGCGT
ncbi:MAG TPA: thiosulfate oxidation carrier protein SoxY [Accumulibacter sp.]|nr:thiosulfate oxidation carrier protein SoxY [Accumulibacter sp.]